MKKFIILLAVIVFTFTLNASAQLVDKADIQSAKENSLGLKPVAKPFSLIDLSRIKWSHSYSVNYFSGGGTSTGMGLYTGSMFYEISPSLSIDMQLSVAHNPGSLFNNSVANETSFYPAMNLDYHPSENFRLSLRFISVPAGYYNPYYFYNPYRMYDWRTFNR